MFWTTCFLNSNTFCAIVLWSLLSLYLGCACWCYALGNVYCCEILSHLVCGDVGGQSTSITLSVDQDEFGKSPSFSNYLSWEAA